MKQQIDQPVAAGGTVNQAYNGRSYAAQTGQGREKRGVHGLTVLKGTVI